MVKVLIIDDEPLICKLYKQALLSDEFAVEAVNSGEEGVDLAKTFSPNIILLDIMMPNPNGIEILEKLKADEATKKIPVVVLTNLSGKFDVAYAKSKGAVDYWIKDQLDLQTLGTRISETLPVI